MYHARRGLRRIRQHNACHAADRKEEDEANSPDHGRVKRIEPPHIVAIMRRFSRRGTAITMVAANEVGLGFSATCPQCTCGVPRR